MPLPFPDFRRLVSNCAILCSLFLPPVVLAADPSDAVAVIDPDEIVFDRSQSEWSQAYLQWVATFARASSPVSDTSGAQCAAKQSGDVWFLATSDGTAPVERGCAVPLGKTVFLPIASVLERSGSREPDCAAMARAASANLQHVGALSLTIDGRAVDALPSYRQSSGGCFALGARQVPRVDAKTAVADGYYVMLRPLPAGTHTLVVGARFDNVEVATTYRLEVH
jgi:hypothetical protein